MAPRRRLTVALVVTGPVADEIDGMRRALGADALARVPPHVTLVPPLNVREEEVEEAVEVVRHAAQRSRPLRVQLGPPRTFFPVTPVVFLEVGGDVDGVRALRAALLTGPLGVPAGRQDQREYVPHATLDQHIDPARIPAALETLAAYQASVAFERVTLLEFREDRRRWVPYCDAVLGPASIAGRGGIEIELSVSAQLPPRAQQFQDDAWAAYARETYGPEASPDEPYAVTARIAGEVVGIAAGQLRGPVCRLGNLIVAAEWRSYGVASHLLRAVESLALEQGADRVRLETRSDGPARGFYESLGYVATTDLPAWRHGRDFILMERWLVRRA